MIPLVPMMQLRQAWFQTKPHSNVGDTHRPGTEKLFGSQLEASSWWSCVLICAACHHRFIFGWVTLLLCQVLRSCKCFQKTCEPSCDLHSPTAETRSTLFCKPAHVRFLLLSVLLSRHSKYSQNLLWDDWWLGLSLILPHQKSMRRLLVVLLSLSLSRRVCAGQIRHGCSRTIHRTPRAYKGNSSRER